MCGAGEGVAWWVTEVAGEVGVIAVGFGEERCIRGELLKFIGSTVPIISCIVSGVRRGIALASL